MLLPHLIQGLGKKRQFCYHFLQLLHFTHWDIEIPPRKEESLLLQKIKLAIYHRVVQYCN